MGHPIGDDGNWKLPRRALMSRVWPAIAAVVIAALMAVQSAAHEVRPAIADVRVGPDRLELVIDLTLEPIIAGIDLLGVDDTDNAPEAEVADALRMLDPADLEAAFREEWPRIAAGIRLRAGDTVLQPMLEAVEIPEAGDIELPRDSTIAVTAALPDDDTRVTVGWAAAYGLLVVRQADAGEDGYSDLLLNGRTSDPFTRTSATRQGVLGLFAQSLIAGVLHVASDGLDHILFVLVLVIGALRLIPVLVQITAFTLAHTIAQSLAALGYVTLPVALAVSVIAAILVLLSVENIVRRNPAPWRTAIAVVYGVVHGLAFASLLGGSPGGNAGLAAQLIGFNLGLELGQLLVLAVAFVVFGLWLGQKPWFRSWVAVPASALIGLLSAFWLVEGLVLTYA
ncbi:MAG: HupE/UreJ family protein [Pseudomonadota bacterium]